MGRKSTKPIVMIIGTNNHWRTIVYEVVILTDENLDMYCWFLKTFLDAMFEKELMTVITENDKAMIGAIEKVFSNTNYVLGTWRGMHKLQSTNMISEQVSVI